MLGAMSVPAWIGCGWGGVSRELSPMGTRLLRLGRADIHMRARETRQAALVGAEVVGRAGDGVVPGVDGGAGGTALR